MTYIDYLNNFNQWLETNALPASSQLMYYKLLHIFNRAGWPEDVGVDNLRLRQMIGNASEKTAIQARDKLVESGFITYQRGKKGYPNRYSLNKIYCKNYSVSDSENDSKKVSENDSISVSINASHIKTKKKTKTKNISPLPPEEKNWGFGADLSAAFSDWLTYKEETGRWYTPTSLKTLIAEVQKETAQYGETAVADAIRKSIANNWQRIVWDKLKKADGPADQSGASSKESHEGLSSVADDMARMEKYLQKLKEEKQDGEL